MQCKPVSSQGSRFFYFLLLLFRQALISVFLKMELKLSGFHVLNKIIIHRVNLRLKWFRFVAAIRDGSGGDPFQPVAVRSSSGGLILEMILRSVFILRIRQYKGPAFCMSSLRIFPGPFL